MIDGAGLLILLGAAMQAAPSARALVAFVQRRPLGTELQRCLPFTPLPRRNRALEQLIAHADIALTRD